MASSKYKPVDLESDFADLYCGIIPKIYNMSSHEFMRQVRIALKDIRQLKHDIDKKEEKLFYAYVQFQRPQYRCAYLYAYSLLHTAAVHHHFTNYVKMYRNAVSSYFKDNKVKICCLGGGPGIEAVSICKVLNDVFLEISASEQFPFLDIYVTVIDICDKWEHEVLPIVEAVNKNSSILDKKIKLHAKFIQANLLKPFETNVQKEIENANIITMVKLASAVLEGTPYKPNDALQNMMMRVADCMKKESCLFFVDNAGGGVFSRLTKCLTKSYSIYETMEHEKHTLNIKALQKMEKLIRFEKSTPFSLCIPTRITTVSSLFCIEESQHEEKVRDNVDSTPSVIVDKPCELDPGNVKTVKSAPTKKLSKKERKSFKDKTTITSSKKKSSKKNQDVSPAVAQDQIDIAPSKSAPSKKGSNKKSQAGSSAVVQDLIDIAPSKSAPSKKGSNEKNRADSSDVVQDQIDIAPSIKESSKKNQVVPSAVVQD